MRILILDGLGIVGHQIYRRLSQEFNQLKVCIPKSSGETFQYGFFNPTQILDNVDLLHDRILEVTLRNANPDLIINCAGSVAPKGQRVNPSEIIELNALFPQKLYEWCQKNSAFLINFSNDEIFAGSESPYFEDSLSDARSIYGRAKALGEIDGPQCLTLRSSFLGPELGTAQELFMQLAQNPNQMLGASKEQFYSGVSTMYLSNLVADWIRHGLPISGLFQIASQPISEYDLLQLFNREFGWNLKVTPLPATVNKHKILSNQKILQHWPATAPKWSDMVYDLGRSIETMSESKKKIAA